MTAHQDVAGLVARLRFDADRCDIQFSKGVATNITEAADRLESLSQALREVEERATVSFRCGVAHQDRANEMQDRAIAAESRLAEATKVIGGGIAAWEALPEGNYSPKTIERWLKDNLKPHADAARAFIAGNGGKDE